MKSRRTDISQNASRSIFEPSSSAKLKSRCKGYTLYATERSCSFQPKETPDAGQYQSNRGEFSGVARKVAKFQGNSGVSMRSHSKRFSQELCGLCGTPSEVGPGAYSPPCSPKRLDFKKGPSSFFSSTSKRDLPKCNMAEPSNNFSMFDVDVRSWTCRTTSASRAISTRGVRFGASSRFPHFSNVDREARFPGPGSYSLSSDLGKKGRILGQQQRNNIQKIIEQNQRSKVLCDEVSQQKIAHQTVEIKKQVKSETKTPMNQYRQKTIGLTSPKESSPKVQLNSPIGSPLRYQTGSSSMQGFTFDASLSNQ